MIEPKSKLPWTVDKCFQEKKYGEECWCAVINDADTEVGVCSYGSICKQDATYIVEAANNYPKAVELLKTWSKLDKVYGISDYTVNTEKKLLQDREEFLKSIGE